MDVPKRCKYVTLTQWKLVVIREEGWKKSQKMRNYSVQYMRFLFQKNLIKEILDPSITNDEGLLGLATYIKWSNIYLIILQFFSNSYLSFSRCVRFPISVIAEVLIQSPASSRCLRWESWPSLHTAVLPKLTN